MRQLLTKSLGAGFTAIELMIAVFMLGLVAPIVFSALGDFYDDANRVLTQTVKYTNVQTAFDIIKSDLSTSTNFLARSIDSQTFTPSQLRLVSGNNDDRWTYEGLSGSNTNYRVLVTESYATTRSGGRAVPSFINCSGGVMTQTKVMRVYYVKDSTLYRRTILPYADGSGSYCNGSPEQKQSCFSSVRSTYCKAVDAILEREITAFKVDYYNTISDKDPSLKSDSLGPYNTAQAEIINKAQKAKITIYSKQWPDGVSITINLANIGQSLASDGRDGMPGGGDDGGGSDGGFVPTECSGNSNSDSWDVKIWVDKDGVTRTNKPLMVDIGDGKIYVPLGKTRIDYFLVGGGGGGQGGWILSAGGGGGRGGQITVGTISISDVPEENRTILFRIGMGGKGTRGGGLYKLLPLDFVAYPSEGKDGTATTLTIDGKGEFARANGGNGGSGTSNDKDGKLPVPAQRMWNSRGYCAGLAPGKGANLRNGEAGNKGLGSEESRNAGSGGAGGSGVSIDNFDFTHAWNAYHGGDGAPGIIRLRFY